MMNGRPGGRYIVSGRSEDNRYLADMLGIIAGVLKEREPLRPVRSRFPVMPGPVVRVAAFFTEALAVLRGTPCLLSRAAARAGSFPSFYSNEETEREIGYAPRKSFCEAVEDAYTYSRFTSTAGGDHAGIQTRSRPGIHLRVASVSTSRGVFRNQD